MKKIQNFQTFSQLKTQLKEQAVKKEIAIKREASIAEYNELLSKYNVSKITELSEKDKAIFLAELTQESTLTEGKKVFKVNSGIGKSKYSISSHDGVKKHKDGSDFFDIEIFNNKVDLEKGIKKYTSDGFVKESVNEAFKHIIHVDTPTQIVSKPIAAQIMALAKRGVRSKEIGLEMGFTGNAKLAADTFQKVKNRIYFELDENESVNEGKYDADLDKIEAAVKNASSFMNVGAELKKMGIKYDFSTSMIPMYRIKVSGNTIAIVNKKYAAGAEREVNDLAIGLMENITTESEVTEEVKIVGEAAIKTVHNMLFKNKGFKDIVKSERAAVIRKEIEAEGISTKGVSDDELIQIVKDLVNESVVTEGKDDFMARYGSANINLKKGYKHHTEEELNDLYDKLGDLVKTLRVKDVTLVFESVVNKGKKGKKTQTLEVVYQGPIKKYRGDLFKARREDNGTYTVFLDEPGRQIVEVPASDVRLVESAEAVDEANQDALKRMKEIVDIRSKMISDYMKKFPTVWTIETKFSASDTKKFRELQIEYKELEKEITNESLVTEAEIKSDDEFKEYAFTVLQKAFGEDFDEAKAQEVVDGLTSKYDGDYGAMVGALQSSLA